MQGIFIFTGKRKIILYYAKNIFIFVHTKSPPGGIPGKNMIIRESEDLTYLAEVAKKSKEHFSKFIFSFMVDNGLLLPDGDYWGATIKESLPGETPVSNVFSCMLLAGIKPSFDNYIRFINLVMMLDGECDNCGYDMEVIDSEECLTGGDGYLTPYEYQAAWETKKCIHCGYVKSNEPC